MWEIRKMNICSNPFDKEKLRNLDKALRYSDYDFEFNYCPFCGKEIEKWL